MITFVMILLVTLVMTLVISKADNTNAAEFNEFAVTCTILYLITISALTVQCVRDERVAYELILQQKQEQTLVAIESSAKAFADAQALRIAELEECK